MHTIHLMVSDSVSPFFALLLVESTGITVPPRRNMAAWKEQFVRVLAS